VRVRVLIPGGDRVLGLLGWRGANFSKLIASGGFAAIGVCHSVDQMLNQIARRGIPLQNDRAAA
jgi:hypothetical protein